MEEEDDEIVRSTNCKKQTIPVIIYYIKKQVEFIHNEIKKLKINWKLKFYLKKKNEKKKLG
jgi:hypothetical protein